MFCMSKGNKETAWSVNHLYLYIILISIAITWCGFDSIHAIECDSVANDKIVSVSFPNAVQAQKAERLAKQAALQKREVIAARENGDSEEADVLYNKAFDSYYDQITSMHTNGMGWVDIARALGVNPAVLGVDHFKKG